MRRRSENRFLLGASVSHYSQAKFNLSAPDISHLGADKGIEVAFAGRSNAGKSSALNRLTRQTPSEGETPEDVIEAGSKLYRGGDLERGITACTACHGPRGNGTSLSGFPDISGQHTAYLKAQLEAFRSGQRANSHNGMMEDIAKRLTDQDIDILSKYISGLY